MEVVKLNIGTYLSVAALTVSLITLAFVFTTTLYLVEAHELSMQWDRAQMDHWKGYGEWELEHWDTSPAIHKEKWTETIHKSWRIDEWYYNKLNNLLPW